MSSKYIIAHDVGTSGDKAIIVDMECNIYASAWEGYKVYYPKANYAEQDPDDLWNAVVNTTKEVMEKSGIAKENVVGMIFSTQLLGIIPIGKSGDPLCKAIIWMDGRACKQAEKIMNKFGGSAVFTSFVGTPISGKDVLAKLLWLKEEMSDVYNEMTCFLDVNGYLLYRTTGEKVYEWSCASAVSFDFKKKDWLRGVFKYIGLDMNKFPRLVRSIDIVGGLTNKAAERCGLLPGTPVFGGAGDMHSAAIGSGAVNEGEGHIYLGTSGWVGISSSKAPKGGQGIVSLQSAIPDKALIIGEMETAGACLSWIADEFYKHEKEDPSISNVYALMDKRVSTIPPGSGYLLFTPWLTGERCPVFDTTVRSTFFNLDATHTRDHMLRAVYEGIAYNLRWIMEILEKNYNFPLSVLRVIGGGSKSNEWMQIISDVTQKEVETVIEPQMSGAVGVSIIAAVGSGYYKDFSSVHNVVKSDKRFIPEASNKIIYNELYMSYKDIYHSLKKSYHKMNSNQFKSSIVEHINSKESVTNINSNE